MAKNVLLQDLQKGTVTVCPIGKWISAGRASATNEVVAKDKHVSRNHCRLQAQPDGSVQVTDRSSYGTFINDERIGGTSYAQPGDTVCLGTTWQLKVLHGFLDDDASHEGAEEPLPPRRLGAHYILLREVGRGGMGIVYEAYDEKNARRVALKWLREGGQATEESIERFKREAMLQGRLSEYPGVVKMFDLGVLLGSGEMYCVMEFVDGESLLDKIQTGLDVTEGVKILSRVARAVDYAHDNGVIHRDLKPANVLITAKGRIRLTDFGIAKALDDGSGRTKTGRFLGTPGYVAPEQIDDAKRVEQSADIYALGAVLYTILTKKLPVRGKSMRDAMLRVARGDKPPEPSEYVPDVDPVLEAACLRALAFDPTARWASAAAFAQELERWLAEHDPSAKVELSGPE